MLIQFACSCGRKLQARGEHVGCLAQCPSCGAEMTVPTGETTLRPLETALPGPSPIQAGEPGRPKADDDRIAGQSGRRGQDNPERDGRRDEPVVTSRKARAALRLGLLSFCLSLFTGVPAIILGIRGLGEIGRSRGRLGGKRLAIAGIILAAVGTVLSPLGYAYGVTSLYEAVQRATVEGRMKDMAQAMHSYNDTFQHLPEAVPDPKLGGRTKLSWRVELLPYLGQNDLYQEFHHDEPWDSPHNKALLTRMPKVFAHPKHAEANEQGSTYYRVFTGRLTAFPLGQVSSIPKSFPIGTSNTLLIVEAADPVPWTKPDELVYDPDKPLPKLGGHFKKGFVTALGDGTVRVVGPKLKEDDLRHCIDQTYNPWGNW